LICQRKEASAEAGRLPCPFHCRTPAAAALPAHCAQHVFSAGPAGLALIREPDAWPCTAAAVAPAATGSCNV